MNILTKSLLTLSLLSLPMSIMAQKTPLPHEKETLLNEPYRPQFHYTPLQNFMNDPNGLVYYKGEFHLFHQYNPFGNQWGHMSWNHAVSRDLVHWTHLPVALTEEQGIMIFSGSAVMDEANTSGFGSKKSPPMVAIYTGHRVSDEMQSQCLAYSTDRGRTWTKYAHNPVIGWERDFRDPKVFWHTPTKKWIMVVSKAAEKRLRFYGSPDLKHWNLLSEFAGQGVPDNIKANWECPDLFPLPIEGEEGGQKWVLHAGMGNGHVSGGSGGEYFVGDFDGVRFHNDNSAETVLWADYGKDNYAAVSWSGITAKGGEVYWLGWMSNWQYANDLPTSPWRNALTIPRLLSLRRTPEGLRLRQRPIPQLKRLRAKKQTYKGIDLSPQLRFILSNSLGGETVEIVAEFELGTATEFGIDVRVGLEEEVTKVGYDVEAKRLFVDRTHSGKSDFHPEFRGKHTAPLLPQQHSEHQRVTLHLFVDRSSVEVFGNEGEAVLSELIFPKQENQAVRMYAKSGTARLIRLDIWKLKSALAP